MAGRGFLILNSFLSFFHMASTRITFEHIVKEKELTREQLYNDLRKLIKYDATTNERKFCGNDFLYHFQTGNLMKTSIKGKKTLAEKLLDDKEYASLHVKMEKLKRTGTLPIRMFEAERFNNAVVFFKPSTAKYLYKTLGATKVLDFTAGWGGRMLGAYALGIDYIGIDTNTSLKPAYDSMMEFMAPASKSTLGMIWDSCLNVDFSKLDYDCVLTSPPYVNLEVYEHMSPFESDAKYYNEFLIPMINKSLTHIKAGGKVCINISPKMYDALKKNGMRECDSTIELLQQKRLGKDKSDKIYIWNK